MEKYNVSSTQWLHDAEMNSADGEYINLVKNSEAFTNYNGRDIWNAIYQENCFSNNLENICTEEKMLYKLISGLHANINIHLSVNYLDLKRNFSYVNVTMYNERVTNHPDRMNNLFFLYSVLLRAFSKAEPNIKNYLIHTGNDTEDTKTKEIISKLYATDETQKLCSSCKDTEEMRRFLNFNKIDQIILRFRNISAIIDCVSCQKCRLHGKLQIYGLATVLKILFYKDYQSMSELKLSRNEIISFINLVGKVSKSISYIRKINESVKYSHFIHKLKYVIIFLLYSITFIYFNFYLFKEKQNNEKEKEKKNFIQSENGHTCKHNCTNHKKVE